MSKTLENKTKVMTPLGKGTIIGFEYFLQNYEKGTFVKVYSVRLDYRMQNENYYDKGLLPIFLFTENELREKVEKELENDKKIKNWRSRWFIWQH